MAPILADNPSPGPITRSGTPTSPSVTGHETTRRCPARTRIDHGRLRRRRRGCAGGQRCRRRRRASAHGDIDRREHRDDRAERELPTRRIPTRPTPTRRPPHRRHRRPRLGLRHPPFRLPITGWTDSDFVPGAAIQGYSGNWWGEAGPSPAAPTGTNPPADGWYVAFPANRGTQRTLTRSPYASSDSSCVRCCRTVATTWTTRRR